MTHAAQSELEELIRRGADLFNRGQYYECHELFEEAWMGAEGAQRLFLQGVIQLAVALHHLTGGNVVGARRLLGEAASKLRAHESAQRWIAAAPLASAAETILQALTAGAAAQLEPAPQIRLLPAAR